MRDNGIHNKTKSKKIFNILKLTKYSPFPQNHRKNVIVCKKKNQISTQSRKILCIPVSTGQLKQRGKNYSLTPCPFMHDQWSTTKKTSAGRILTTSRWCRIVTLVEDVSRAIGTSRVAVISRIVVGHVNSI